MEPRTDRLRTARFFAFFVVGDRTPPLDLAERLQLGLGMLHSVDEKCQVKATLSGAIWDWVGTLQIFNVELGLSGE